MGVWRRSTRRCKSIPSTTMPWLTKTSWFANVPTLPIPRKSTKSRSRWPTIGSRRLWRRRRPRPKRRTRPAPAASSSIRTRSKHHPSQYLWGAGQGGRRLDPEGSGDEEGQGRKEEQDRRRQHRPRSEPEVSIRSEERRVGKE